jgi:hypothetical protein
MSAKGIGNAIVLSPDRLADEKRIRAVLAQWDMDEVAIQRMLKFHQASGEDQRPKEAATTGGEKVSSDGKKRMGH